MERTISGMMGKGSLAHNSRVFTADNVDAERTKNNIEYCNKNLKQVYHTLFDESVKTYNEKQTRKDRMIDNYYDKIRTGKQEKLFYEAVFQIGNKYDTNTKGEYEEIAELILNKFMEDFQKQNPNLYVFSAHLHMDEETPHLHIDFVPFTTGSKRGLETRTSLKQALKAQGFEGGNKRETEWNLWMESEKKRLSEVMEQYGIQWVKLGTHQKHLSVLDYEKQEREKEVWQLDNKIQESIQKIQDAEKQVKIKQSEIIQTGKRIEKMACSQLNVEKNLRAYQVGKEWQLPEATAFTTAKTFREKMADPLVIRLKEVIQTIIVQNMELSRKLEATENRLAHIVQQAKQIQSRLVTIKQENGILKNRCEDIKRIEQVLGTEKVNSFIERQKAIERQKVVEQQVRVESIDNNLKRRKVMKR